GGETRERQPRDVDVAARVARQRADDEHVTRHLVRRKLGLERSAQRFAVNVRAWRRDDARDEPDRAALFMNERDRIGNAGWRGEPRLDLGGLDIHAADAKPPARAFAHDEHARAAPRAADAGADERAGIVRRRRRALAERARARRAADRDVAGRADRTG